MEYDDKNTFILFYESDKKTEKSPDFTGTLTDENGKKWRIAGWERVSKSGKAFISGKVSEFQEKKSGSWEQAREKFAKKDEVITDEQIDEPIDLSEIPF